MFRAVQRPSIYLRYFQNVRTTLRHFSSAEAMEFKETDATFRSVWKHEDLGIKTKKLQEFEQGEWITHVESGQPAVLRRLIKRNIGTGRGSSRFMCDFRVGMPLVSAWEKFTDVNGVKNFSTFPTPAENPYCYLSQTEDEKYVYVKVVGEDNQPMTVHIAQERKKTLDELKNSLLARRDTEIVQIKVQEIPIRKEHGFEVGQIVQKIDIFSPDRSCEFQLLYHEEEEDDKVIFFCIDDEGENVELMVNKLDDGGKLWAKLANTLETYENTGALMYIKCFLLEMRFGKVSVVQGARLAEI